MDCHSFISETNIKTNLPYDEELIVDDNDHNNFDETYSLYPPKPIESNSFKDIEINIGLGNFDYINNQNDKEMITNAWQAITLTKMWPYLIKNVDSYMFSNDYQLDIIYEKMEELGYKGHSGGSFGITMRYMQHLAQNGEDEFKKFFIR